MCECTIAHAKLCVIITARCVYDDGLMVIMMRKSYHVVLFTPNLNIYVYESAYFYFILDANRNEYGFRLRANKQSKKDINDFEWYGKWPINNRVWDKQSAYVATTSQRSLKCVYMQACFVCVFDDTIEKVTFSQFVSFFSLSKEYFRSKN